MVVSADWTTENCGEKSHQLLVWSRLVILLSHYSKCEWPGIR